MSVVIFADSTCDLSPELVARYDIRILPLHILLGEKEYEDGATITPDEIYAWADEHKATPKTSAIGLESTVDAFRPVIEAGDEIVSFAISSHMSSTSNIMRLAAEELGASDRVHVVDSENLSTGIGLLVIEAAEMAASGKTAAEIAAAVEALRPKVRASFVVDTLTYLHRGGRCSSVAAIAGIALKLHPQISVIDGKMLAGKKYRGPIARVVMLYARDQEKALLTAKSDRVFITHSGCTDAIVADVKAYLESLGRFKEILITRAGCVISSHCGPSTLGVLFIDNSEV
ncbi:MAG: DegV family protein [Ruminococcaceae bacterium]|nr:DegV family protein [Oscillospiraceae bacterium]